MPSDSESRLSPAEWQVLLDMLDARRERAVADIDYERAASLRDLRRKVKAESDKAADIFTKGEQTDAR